MRAKTSTTCGGPRLSSDGDKKGVAAALEAIEVLSDGTAAPDPSPTPPDEDQKAADDDGQDPGESVAPDDIDWDVLRICADQPQNDIGNSRRLLARHGQDVLHVQNVAYFAWDDRRWAEDVDLRRVKPFCHKTSELIAFEPLVMTYSEVEAAQIEAADRAVVELRDAETRLIDVDDIEDMSAKARAARKAEIHGEINHLRAIITEGKKAKAGLSSRRGKRRGFGVSSGNAGKLAGMLGEATSYISKPVNEMDQNPLALNLENVCLHFSAGADPEQPNVVKAISRPHERKDYMTKMAEVAFDPDAKAPDFHKFLETVLPKPEIRDFVQRYFGYCCTALTREQVFVLFHGEGRNGKSTLVDIVAKILGDYSTTVPIATLVNDNKAGKGSEATPDLARLPGARLVRSAEPREGLSFDESLIKGLTSGEPLAVRRLNQDFIDIYPTFKLIISANRKPTIKGNDDGIWRRVMLVPFDVQIPEDQVDKQLAARLWDERSGILNWLIEGACSYLEIGGLDAPEDVKAATKEYRDESDLVGGYVRAALEVTLKPEDTIETGKLYAGFVAYCGRQGLTPFGGSTFNRRITKTATQFGFTKGKSSISVYSGIRFRDGFDPSHRHSSHTSDENLGG
jgi:putative DNA primase/helicase